MKMTLALPIWEDRISTTLDFAQTVLIVEVEGGRELARREIAFSRGSSGAKAQRLHDLGVDRVLCGAVSDDLARAVIRAGVRITPYVSGAVDAVLAACLCDRLAEPRFLQPGCRPGARKRWRHGPDRGRGRGRCAGNNPTRRRGPCHEEMEPDPWEWDR